MRKRLYLLVVCILAVFMVLSFSACDTTEKEEGVTVKSLSLLTQHEGDYILNEDIDLSEITCLVTYSDGTTKTVVVDDTYLSAEDRNKFFVIGTHTVTVSYGTASCKVQFTVSSVDTVKTYHVTYYSLGGTQIPSTTVTSVTAFPVPEREGYIFDGWYTDIEYKGDKVREPYTLSADTCFYAKWIDNRVCSVYVYADTYVELPMSNDWDTLTDDAKVKVGDVFKGYEYDGENVTKLIVLRGDDEIKLSVGTKFNLTPEKDRLQEGDVIYKFDILTDGTYKGIIVSRKNVLLNSSSVHYGEKYSVSTLDFPEVDADGHDISIEGKHFLNWNVTNGDADNVTVDLQIRANFQTEKCTVTIYYFNSNDEEISVNETYDYGSVFAYSNYKMPTKEGYTSRWVVYYNHEKKYVCNQCGHEISEDKIDIVDCPICQTGRMVEEGYEELDETGKVILTNSHTLFQANHVVNTFKVSVRNAKQEQTEIALKNAEFSWETMDFVVEWNSDFDYTTYTQNPKLDTPANVSDGYSSQWCYVVKDAQDKETYYNGQGQIWDEEAEDFIEPQERPSGEGQTNWVLYDSQGNYIARVRDGILTEIKASVNMYAKYVKKDRTVMFRREYGNSKGLVAKFIVPFYEDFSAYDPFAYIDTSLYAISPDRDSDSSPVPDSVVREKMAIYEKVRLYELYLLKKQYTEWKTAGMSEEQLKVFVWFAYNKDEWESIMEMMYGDNKNALDSRVKTAFKTAYPGIVETDVKELWSEYAKISTFADYNLFYNKYQSRIYDYGFCYETIFDKEFTIFGDGTKDSEYPYTLAECENAYTYYKDSQGYRFYKAQINRDSVIAGYNRAVKYAQYLAEPTNVEIADYVRYSNDYDLYHTKADYLYYYAGIEGAETEERRIVRLAQITASDIESFYLFSDTNQDLRQKSTFYTTNGTEDWSLVWYTNSDKTENSKVNIHNTLEIKDDITFYCDDVDNRRYQLTFQYDYNFKTNSYKLYSVSSQGSEEITLDATLTSSVYREINGTNVEYKFLGWYDTPYYSYLTTGYRNDALKLTGTHTENVVYYAHYYTSQTFSVKIVDATQAVAYSGIDGYEDGYAVAEDTIKYELPAGSIFSVQDLYKGIANSNGSGVYSSVVNGQRYYNQKRFIDYFEAYYQSADGLYKALETQYTLSSKTLTDSLNEMVEAYRKVKNEYTSVLTAVKDHDYAQFDAETYLYYLTEFTKYHTEDGDIGTVYIADRRAFIEAYLDIVEDIYAQNYADISELTDDFTDGIMGKSRYTKVDIDKTRKEEWEKYYRNYFVLENENYVSAGNVYDENATYYTFIVTTDYEYYYMVSYILNLYLTFVKQYESNLALYNSYSTQPMHTYMDSMNDINRANGYDYEGAGDIKYNFIGWYSDASYTSVYNKNVVSEEYVQADEEVRLNTTTWDKIYTQYFYFDSDYTFKQAPYTYNEDTTYYQYNDKQYYLSNDFALSIYENGKWNDCKTYFYIFSNDSGSACYKSAGTYDADTNYYLHYKNVSSILSANLGKWNDNYTQFFVKNGDEYVQADSVYDKEKTYYQSNTMNLSFIVQSDIVLYAKWMDISRGTEGLVYEMVCEDGSTDIAGYVVIDLVNIDQSEQYQSLDNIYITANDNNTIPQKVVAEGSMLELQIPASIDGYKKATITEDIIADWSNVYTDYFIFDKTSYSYVNAEKNYSSTQTYYDKNEKITYPVLGVRADAFTRYSDKINIINLPLNLDFIEEGAFKLCPIVKITRAKARAGEIAGTNIVIDENNADSLGVAIYQEDKCLTVYESVNLYEGAKRQYSSAESNTILCYAVKSEINSGKSYTLNSGTKRIGAYAFTQANITSVLYETGDTSTLTSIGEAAFAYSKLTAFTLAASVTSIEEKAFYSATDLDSFVLMNNSQLRHVGAYALKETGYYNNYDERRALICLEWTEIDGEDTYTRKILLSYDDSTGDRYYEKDEQSNIKKYGCDMTYSGGAYNKSDVADAYAENSAGEYVIVFSADEKDYIAYLYNDGETEMDTIVLGSDFVAIADNAFEKIAVKRVIINSTYLEFIGSYAFSGSTALTTLWFVGATGAVQMGEGVFSGKADETLTVVDPTGNVQDSTWDAYQDILIK